jgi:hypothetical protein
LHTIATFKQIKKIRDDRFDEESIHEYSLLINIGPRDIQVAVLHGPENLVLFLQDYVFPGVSSTQELIDALDELFEQHAFLKAGFWKTIKLSFKNQKLVQVPRELFVQESAAKYLKFNAPINKTLDEVFHIDMRSSQAVTIFAVQKDLKGFFEKTYPKNQFTITHQSAALIEGVLEQAHNQPDNPLYLYIDRFKLHLLSVVENELVYYNQFSIQNFQDYVKYIMLVMKTLNMDQESSHVVLWGYIGNNSPHYHEFSKYISRITFGKRPRHLTFGYPFDEVQNHHYFDLYNINLSR